MCKWYAPARMNALYIIWPVNHLDSSDSATFSSEIRPTCSMQNLIVREFGGRLSFFALRDTVMGVARATDRDLVPIIDSL